MLQDSKDDPSASKFNEAAKRRSKRGTAKYREKPKCPKIQGNSIEKRKKKKKKIEEKNPSTPKSGGWPKSMVRLSAQQQPLR